MKLEKFVDDYLKIGGYPEYVLEENPAYFSDLINNILYKDIVNLYKLKNPDLLKDLILLLADRVAHQTTYTKLASVLSIKLDTVKEYMFFLKNTFLIDELPRFSLSRSTRIYGPKKFYLQDNGILFHLLGKFSYGQVLEQVVFNFLKNSGKKIGFYYENQKEADFLVENNGKLELWEVKYEINEFFENKINDYIKIAKLKKIKKIIFITKSFEKIKKKENIEIKFMPFWKII
ncbi:ATP-binding protein [Candidatus Kuenenbacteria bacterium]|nr:ATP-binding protein [Candidatus Kuenenbacteria bacterium]